MFKQCAFTFIALAAGLAQAAEHVQIDGIGRVPYETLFEAVSEPGESRDDFAASVAPRLVAYSSETGFEACAVLGAHPDGRWGVLVGTNHAHVACANLPNKVPAGFRPLAMTIHSHGNGAASLNRTDMRFLGLSTDARTKRMSGQIYGQSRDHFSERDLGGLPGYLATPQGVLFHDGKGNIRRVK